MLQGWGGFFAGGVVFFFFFFFFGGGGGWKGGRKNDLEDQLLLPPQKEGKKKGKRGGGGGEKNGRPGGPPRLTVVRIIDRLNVGGPAIHAVLTAGGLDPERFRTVLVIGSVEPGEADMSYLLESQGIECVVIPSLGRELRPLRDIHTAWQLFKVIRRERPDVVHTHKAKAGALGRTVAALMGVPVIVHTFHGHVLRGYFGPAKSRFFLGLEQILARFTTKLVALSDRLVTELADDLKVAPRERFQIVPLGFDLAPFAACERGVGGVLRDQIGVGPDAKLLAIIGRMVPVKGHDTFVAAAAELARTRADVHFVFVGGGELEDRVRQDVADRGLSSRAHFLGWQRDLASPLRRSRRRRSLLHQ